MTRFGLAFIALFVVLMPAFAQETAAINPGAPPQVADGLGEVGAGLPPQWRVIRIAAVERSPYIGPNLLDGGYAHEVIERVFAKMGVRVSVAFYPLARARRMAEHGEVDAVLSYTGKQVLDNAFEYSQSFPAGEIGLLKRKDRVAPIAMTERADGDAYWRALAGYHFGVVRGAHLSESFDLAVYLNKEQAADDLQNLDKLVAGRIDFAVVDKLAAAALLVERRPSFIGQLEFVEPAFAVSAYQLAVPVDHRYRAQLIESFNTALVQVRSEGTLRELRRRHALMPPDERSDGITRIRIATVNNTDMQIMQTLSRRFEQSHPNVRIIWDVLDEVTLRRRLMSDLAIGAGRFDVMTIGGYETPIWARRGWLAPIDLPPGYHADDLVSTVRELLTVDGRMFALPFYAESSMLYYRKDWFEEHGLVMPGQPTYDDLIGFAAKLHDPSAQRYGACLRGKAGWGENVGTVSTMVHTFGGRWFDPQWRPELDTRAWSAALSAYATLQMRYGPPQPWKNGYNESLALFADGKCALWVDATVAAGTVLDPRRMNLAGRVGYAPAPVGTTSKGSRWLWVWALGVPTSSRNQATAQAFVRWATSEAYIEQVAQTEGWISVPPGTRVSTYAHPEYQAAAPFAGFVLEAIQTMDQKHPSVLPVPYAGVRLVGIPEFTAIGYELGNALASMLKGEMSEKRVLAATQNQIKSIMKRSGYYDTQLAGCSLADQEEQGRCQGP